MRRFNFLLMFIIASMWQWTAAAVQDTTDIVWMKYTQNITKVQFSNDDSKILTVGDAGTIIFDTQTGSQIKQLSGNGGYNDDGTLILSSHLNNIDHYIDVFNADTYDTIRRILLPQIIGNYGINLSPDGQTIIAGGYNDLYFIDFLTGVIKKHLTKFGTETRTISLGSYIFTKDSKDI